MLLKKTFSISLNSFPQVKDHLLGKLYSASELTPARGSQVLDRFPRMAAMLPTLQGTMEDLLEDLGNEPLFENLKEFSSVGSLISCEFKTNGWTDSKVILSSHLLACVVYHVLYYVTYVVHSVRFPGERRQHGVRRALPQQREPRPREHHQGQGSGQGRGRARRRGRGGEPGAVGPLAKYVLI